MWEGVQMPGQEVGSSPFGQKGAMRVLGQRRLITAVLGDARSGCRNSKPNGHWFWEECGPLKGLQKGGRVDDSSFGGGLNG